MLMVSVIPKVPLSHEHAWLSCYCLDTWSTEERFQRGQYTVMQSLGLPRGCGRSLQRISVSFIVAVRFAIKQSTASDCQK